MDFDQVAVNGVNSNKYRELLSGSSNILWGMPEKREVQRMEEQQKTVKAHKLVVKPEDKYGDRCSGCIVF